MPSEAARFRAISRECDSQVLEVARARLLHARDAGLLDSYDGAIHHDGVKLLVMLDVSLIPNRADLPCEEEIVRRVIERAISRASTTLPPHGG